MLVLTLGVFFACVEQDADDASPEDDRSLYINAVEDEPDTVDFQRTTIYYTVATNVFDRLVETETEADGSVRIAPSLAESWEVSLDETVYTFHLRDNVYFSNGSKLTAKDVYYSFKRLLTFPGTCNHEILEVIVGAKALEEGRTDSFEGIAVLGELDLSITLERPFEAFLANLSMPGASILDEESTEKAGERFGMEPACTVGTGSFILKEWTPEEGMILTANKSCWKGAPKCGGLNLRFLTEPEEIRELFEEGELDIIDLDDVGTYAEFFLHGDIYQDRLFSVPRIGIVYLTLNNSVPPLDDARVRRALQVSLDRQLLLNAVYDGLGRVEHGIFPQGLYGFDPELPEIPYSPEEARALLAEAGLLEGFDLTVSIRSSATQSEMTLIRMAESMWEKVGVNVNIEVMDEGEFMRLRKSGKLSCYTASWMADFNDPDNFIYTFFGNVENTTFRSICYQREDIMERVDNARAITDSYARITEYRELERIIVQEDAAWIPLFSRFHVYVFSERLKGVRAMWNGSVKNCYSEMSVVETPIGSMP